MNISTQTIEVFQNFFTAANFNANPVAVILVGLNMLLIAIFLQIFVNRFFDLVIQKSLEITSIDWKVIPMTQWLSTFKKVLTTEKHDQLANWDFIQSTFWIDDELTSSL